MYWLLIKINALICTSLFYCNAGRAEQPTYTGSDVPAQDVFDNQFSKAPGPSAPPPDMFAQYTGYENTHFGM